MRHFLVAAPSYIGDVLVAPGSRLNEAQLGQSRPGSNLIEINSDGSAVNDEDRVRVAQLFAGALPVAVAPIMPHAPNAIHPQAVPGQRAGGVQLAGDLNFTAAQGVESNEAAAARIEQLEKELAEARALVASAREAADEDLSEEPPARRSASTSRSDTGTGEPGPLDGSIADLETHLATVDDPAELDRLRSAETGGKSRTGALAAIDNRRAELDQG